MAQKTVSFLIPVYRNEGTLKLTFENIINVFNEKLHDLKYEFVFVDDGSDDGSINELIELHRRDKNVKIISFTRNFGQLNAVIAGLKLVSGDCVIHISADLQDPVQLIADMVTDWNNGCEVVICHRTEREDSFLVNLTSRLFYGLMQITVPQMPRGGFDFFLIDRKVVSELKDNKERNRFFQGDLLRLGFTTKFISYKRLRRTIGKSQWRLSKKIKYFIDGVLSTSYLPIRFMSLLGIVVAFIGFLYGTIIFGARILGNIPFQGWAPIMIIILLLSGFQMLMLGIIGEYLWRTLDQVRFREQYVIRKIYD